jgi:teichuronic acid exporter
MTLGQSIRGGVKWLAFGKVGNRVFEFAFGVALARLLLPADFGMIATIQIFTGFVGMFTSGGMGQSLIRAKQVGTNDFTAVFTLQLAVGLLVYLAFFFGAPLLARFFENPLYTDLVRISALSFLLRPLVSMRNAWLNREMQFKSRTIVEVMTGLVGGLLSVCMALFGMGVWSLTISGLLGALLNNLWLARLTPLHPRLNLDVAAMRRHAGFGAKIVGNDLVNYLRAQSRTLILSKMAGPTFLGLFNKAESLSRLPNQVLMSPTMEPLFRAMSKTQDDLDQTKYLLYRAITLLMAYTTPAYVLLWWIAKPFIGVVYGPNWIAAGGPMSILTLAGVSFNIAFPCSVLLAAQNRLGKEMLASAINLPILAGACFIGLSWGLVGVAWAVVLSHALFAAQLYWLVLRAIPTRMADLLRAVTSGLILGALLFAFLALIDHALGDWDRIRPALYLTVMSALGGGFAMAAFLLLPLPALQTESARWRELVARRLKLPNRRD